MNAGAYGGEMKQVAMETTVLTMDGETRVFAGEAQGFAYRTSAFESFPAIIVKTVFQLAPGDKEEISARMQELMEKRRVSQPLELPSAGSTFKRRRVRMLAHSFRVQTLRAYPSAARACRKSTRALS